MLEGLSSQPERPRRPAVTEQDLQPVDRPKKETNPDVLLWQSFLFAQGDSGLAKEIFEYLSTGPLEGKHLSKDDFRKGLTSTVARNLRKAGAHNNSLINAPFFLRKTTGQERQATDDFAQALEEARKGEPISDEEKAGLVARIAGGFMFRDHNYLQMALVGGGRPVTAESGRDKWSSFLIDFAILKQGTPPWSYAMIAPEYQTMLQDIDSYLKSDAIGSRTARDCKLLIARYIEKHPDLNDEVRAKLSELVSHLDAIMAAKEGTEPE